MRKDALKFAALLSLVLAAALFAPQLASADEDDPSSRVARLGYAHGTVSFNPAGTDDWVSAVLNRPLTTGDKLWNDNGARSELNIGSAVIRLGSMTGFSFLNLSDNTTQVRLTEGTLNISVRSLDTDEIFEVDTPNLAFSVLRPGSYKINVNENGDATIVVVRNGQGEVTGGGQAYTVHPGEIGTFSGTDQLSADIQSYGDDDDDDFDRWCADRDRRAEHSESARYVSPDVVGYEDLDDYGGWRPVPEYGTVWFPHTVVVGWAPYRYGHWVWISPWGWTWVDDAPWGFAPFHYGRWVVVRGVWGWVPCPPRPVAAVAYVRPVYAPALVAWVGGPHWGVGIGVGGVAAGVAWFPLGPRDVFCPSYHVSPRYVENVNISNTTVINRTYVTNVYNNVYVNKTVNVTNIKYQNQSAANAVTATSHQAFTSAQPVGRNMMHVDAREVASAPVAPLTPTVAPQQRSVLGAGADARVRPPAALQGRAVVAKTPPPPAPVSFAKQQQAIQANGGRPPALSHVRQIQSEGAEAARPNIRMAPPARPAAPRNVPSNANRPGNVQSNAPVRPAAPNNPPSANRGDRPGNPPSNTGAPQPHNDRPPSARSGNAGNVNPQLDQKYQQNQERLRQKQDLERQRVEQQQQQDRQKLQQKNADAQRQQQLDQKHQQQLEQLERKHDQQQQKLQQKQQQDRQKQQKQQQSKPPKDKEDRPPHR